MSKKTIAAGFIICRRLELNLIEYLLLQASNGEHHWTPPKGHLDGDETPLQAAERETEEEAGLGKDHLEYFDGFQEKITYPVNGKSKDVYYYLARVRDPQQKIILSYEHQNFRWSNFQDACQLLKHETYQQVLKKADDFLKASLK